MPYKDPEKQKAAQAAWHQKHKPRRSAASANSKKKNVQDARAFIAEYLKTHPCVDCGETDPVVLEFDHREPSEKRKGVAILVYSGFNLETVKAEIEKCDVRCANCHRRKTCEDTNSWRMQLF